MLSPNWRHRLAEMMTQKLIVIKSVLYESIESAELSIEFAYQTTASVARYLQFVFRRLVSS